MSNILKVGKNYYDLSKVSVFQDITRYYYLGTGFELTQVKRAIPPEDVITEIRLLIEGLEFWFSGKNAEFVIEEYKKYLENLKD